MKHETFWLDSKAKMEKRGANFFTNLIDDEKVGLRDARTTLPGDLITSL